MSNVIAFLESVGKASALSMQGEEFVAAVDALEVDDETRLALMSRDGAALGDLLGGRARMICALMPADDDNQKDSEEDDGEDQDSPDEQRESVRRGGLH